MAAMVIVMVVFLVMSGHHGFGGSHERDAHRPTAEPAAHMQYGEAAKPEEETR